MDTVDGSARDNTASDDCSQAPVPAPSIPMEQADRTGGQPVSSGVKRDARTAELPDEDEHGGKFLQVEGMCVVLSSTRTLTTHGRFVYTEPSQFLGKPWAFVKEIKVATTQYGYTLTLSAISMLTSHEEITSNVSSSRKGPASTRLTKKKVGTTMKATIRFHPCHPFESSCFHKQRVRRVKDIQQ